MLKHSQVLTSSSHNSIESILIYSPTIRKLLCGIFDRIVIYNLIKRHGKKKKTTENYNKDIKMSIEQGDSEVTDKTNVCEKKLVEESETVKSRYSPLCRQVSVVS